MPIKKRIVPRSILEKIASSDVVMFFTHGEEAEKDIENYFKKIDDITVHNQYKVLKAFQKNRISDMHFGWNTGYGYDDAGRDAIERVYADIFGCEAALVRTQIVNGTHALSLVLSGILRPGDEMIYISGGPYDTLEEVIGIRGDGMGSLKEFGITYNQVDLKDNRLDIEGIKRAITDKTRMVCLQRAVEKSRLVMSLPFAFLNTQSIFKSFQYHLRVPHRNLKCMSLYVR